MKHKNKEITSRDSDFAKWYTDVVRKANLVSYSSIKGFSFIEPKGYAIWEKMKGILDFYFKKSGHSNVSFPLLMPESLLKKEADHVEGFAPEVAWVTHGGNNKLEERLCIRPTSETLFCEYFSNAIQSYKDLPLLLNQWCNIVRWEKTTRPFLRTREILWQEGHTIHENKEEAQSETKMILDIYTKLFEEYLAIPVISGLKTESEKFAGAEYTYTTEALMYNGVSLQACTTHYFGQKFSKPFNVKFATKSGNEEYAYQTSWGASTRMIGALIMVHGDDNGLVLPPKISPNQVVIVPITNKEEVTTKAKELKERLNKKGISCFIDESEKSPGFKFAENEVAGIPLRLELGPRDLKENQIIAARRDNYEKKEIKIDFSFEKNISSILNTIQKNMYDKAKKRMRKMTYDCFSLAEMKETIEKTPGFIKAMWCGEKDCENKISEIHGIKSRCIVDEKHIDDKCVSCQKKAKHLVIWGIQY